MTSAGGVQRSAYGVQSTAHRAFRVPTPAEVREVAPGRARALAEQLSALIPCRAFVHGLALGDCLGDRHRLILTRLRFTGRVITRIAAPTAPT